MNHDLADLASSHPGPAALFRVEFRHRTTGATGTIQVSDSFAFIGRHSQNSLTLNDPSVSRRHAYVQVVDRTPYVIDLKSRTGIRIAGVSVREGWVNPGQVLTIGEFDIEFSGSLQRVVNSRSPISQQMDSTDFRLAVYSGQENLGRIFSLVQNPLTLIGKDALCNLRIIDRRINSFHASIVKTDRDIRIINIPGSGGVRLNDRLVRSAVLQVGDRISLNGLLMLVQSSEDEPVPTDNSAVKSSSEFDELPPFAEEFGEASPMSAQVSELRQATMMLATLLAEMKREQSQFMHRHLEMMEMLTKAFCQSRSDSQPIPGGTTGTIKSLPMAGAPPKPFTLPQVPQMTDPAEAANLAEAHEWFITKLGKLHPKS